MIITYNVWSSHRGRHDSVSCHWFSPSPSLHSSDTTHRGHNSNCSLVTHCSLINTLHVDYCWCISCFHSRHQHELSIIRSQMNIYCTAMDSATARASRWLLKRFFVWRKLAHNFLCQVFVSSRLKWFTITCL